MVPAAADDIDPAVVRALNIIQDRLAKDLDVNSLARQAGVSRSILRDRFVEALGDPPIRYWTRLRLHKAAQMLRAGKESTANIAYSVGFNSEAAFNRAFKREFGQPPATWRRIAAQEEREMHLNAPAGLSAGAVDDKQTCTAKDGTRIAYALTGHGFPLVKSPTWITNIDTDRSNPSYRHWIWECSRSRRFVRTDMRGFGQSERNPSAFTFDAMVGDLESVIDDLGCEQCDLLGGAHGAAIAIAYAARHPERVRKLVLVNSFAAGWRVRQDPEEMAWRLSLMEMNQREWAFRRSLLGDMFLTLYFPTADQELIDWHNRHFEEFGPVERLVQMIELAADIDVRHALANVRAKTLVCHSRQDANAPLSAGRAVAAAIQGARFVELDSPNHILLGNERAWPVFVTELRAFLGG
jgi:pimeloyl-ACP methyl ester carboxylesterase/AraC-like DNA-binding protein